MNEMSNVQLEEIVEEKVGDPLQIAALARKSPTSASGKMIKKIPPELRKPRVNYAAEPVWHKRYLRRLKEDSQFLRSTVQVAFALLCIWIGVEFHFFMQWGTSGGTGPFVSRPPGAEGFLPISGLMSLKYWLQTEIINTIHPAAIFILLAIVGASIALKKSFCSWLCPIGTLSESLWMLGRKLFKRNLTSPRWLDYPLRSLKYLLLFFFVYSIWQMDVPSMATFIHSPYNKVADIKMYLFFADMSTFALWTIITLMVLSVLVKNFWCRFLCPYGALLGIVGWLSPLKITRNKSTCTDCALCTKACPANIKVHTAGRVWSDECMSCLACVQVCPVKNTLDMRVSHNTKPVPTWVSATLVAGTFVAITGLAILAGHWQNDISKEEYLHRFKELNAPVYQHFHGEVAPYGPND
jgi:Pyruvate/2-oxoacid:ferredoxin oxidoreductase delta subunit